MKLYRTNIFIKQDFHQSVVYTSSSRNVFSDMVHVVFILCCQSGTTKQQKSQRNYIPLHSLFCMHIRHWLHQISNYPNNILQKPSVCVVLFNRANVVCRIMRKRMYASLTQRIYFPKIEMINQNRQGRTPRDSFHMCFMLFV